VRSSERNLIMRAYYQNVASIAVLRPRAIECARNIHGGSTVYYQNINNVRNPKWLTAAIV
jgi:hypothetical protein